MDKRFSSLKKSVILLFVTFNCIDLVKAQSSENKIILAVADQVGNVISDAEIILIDFNKKEKSFKTDKQGTVEISKLAAGDYQIRIVLAGFSNYESEVIKLKAGEIKKLEIVLKIAPIESKVDVEDGKGLDANNYGMVITLNKQEIENLPDDPEELKRVLQRIYGDNLPISVNGINGANIPPKQRIKQIRINQNIFSAQYEGVSGGGIDILTDSSVDGIEGYATFNFSDSRLNAADPFLGRKVPFQSRRFGLGISAPLGKKTSISIDGVHSDRDSSAVINAVVLDSNLQIVNLRQSFANPRRTDDISLTIDSDSIKNHKLYLNYEFNSSRQEGFGVGGFSLSSRAYNNNSREHTLSFSDTYTPSPNLFNQTRFLGKYSKNRLFGGNNQTAINVPGAFFGGGSQIDNSDSNFNFEFYNDTVKNFERYSLSFGTMVRGQQLKQISQSDFGGTYTFSGRIAPVLDVNNNPLTDSTGNIITGQISSLESYRRTLLFRQLGYSASQIRALGGGANQFTISGGNPEIDASQYDYALYLQNSYGISRTVGISFGLRYENQTNIKSNFNISPRFGIIWSPKTNEKKNPVFALPRISAGMGIFYNRFGIDNIISEREADNSDRAYYFITDTNILDSFPNVPSVNSLNQSALPRSLRFIDSRIQTPSQRIFNVNVVKKLPENFSVNLILTHTRSYREAFTANINAPLAETFNPLNQNSGVYPFGNNSNIYKISSTGRSETTRFSANLIFPQWKLFKKPLFINLNYSFTKSRSNVVDGSGSPTDPYDFSKEFAPTTLDGVHSVTGFFNINLPKRFSMGGDFLLKTGSRFNIITGRDTNGDGFYSERPAFASDVNKPGVISTKYGLLDPNPSSTDRIIPRNFGRGFGRTDFNTFISKNIGFNEDKKNKKPPKQRLNIRLTVSNVFNINNKSNPIGNISSPYFLRSISGYSESGFVISNPRRISFGASFYF